MSSDFDLPRIGAAYARVLADEGVNLALTYNSSKDRADKLRTQLIDTHGSDLRLSLHRVDLAKLEDIQKLFKEIELEHEQPVEILVPNAGFSKRIADIEDIELDDFEYTHNVNLRAPYMLVKHFVPGIKSRRWGRIIFVSSIAAHRGGVNGCRQFPTNSCSGILCSANKKPSDYAASKGGLTGMMKNLSARLAPSNISVNDVSPALIGNTGVLPAAQYIPNIVRSIPLGRLGEPEEVAEVVRMFAKSGYVTGQSLIAGGGLK